jgi:hypothetical protein
MWLELFAFWTSHITSQDGVTVTLKTSIQEKLSSNLGLDTNYPNCELSWFSSEPLHHGYFLSKYLSINYSPTILPFDAI